MKDICYHIICFIFCGRSYGNPGGMALPRNLLDAPHPLFPVYPFIVSMPDRSLWEARDLAPDSSADLL
jgi:hypothetical protein